MLMPMEPATPIATPTSKPQEGSAWQPPATSSLLLLTLLSQYIIRATPSRAHWLSTSCRPGGAPKRPPVRRSPTHEKVSTLRCKSYWAFCNWKGISGRLLSLRERLEKSLQTLRTPHSSCAARSASRHRIVLARRRTCESIAVALTWRSSQAIQATARHSSARASSS